MKVEKDKEYWITFECGFRCLLLLIKSEYVIHSKCKNFRYTHYLNYIGFSLNQFSYEYVNDCIQYDQSMCVDKIDNGIRYRKIQNLEEIV